MLHEFSGASIRRVVDRSGARVPEHAHDWPLLSLFVRVSTSWSRNGFPDTPGIRRSGDQGATNSLRTQQILRASSTEGAAIGNSALRGSKHNGSILAYETGYQHLGFEACHPLGTQAGRADHLATE